MARYIKRLCRQTRARRNDDEGDEGDEEVRRREKTARQAACGRHFSRRQVAVDGAVDEDTRRARAADTRVVSRVQSQQVASKASASAQFAPRAVRRVARLKNEADDAGAKGAFNGANSGYHSLSKLRHQQKPHHRHLRRRADPAATTARRWHSKSFARLSMSLRSPS